MRDRLMLAIVIAVALVPISSHAATLLGNTEAFEKARVLQTSNATTTTLPGIDATSQSQTIKAEILQGPDKGSVITFKNDFTQLTNGQLFYAHHVVSDADNIDMWSVSDPYRLYVIGGLALVFLVLVFIFGGLQGIRGIASLIGSIFLIFYLLIPGMYAGYSPILVSIGVSSLIIILGSYITHGFNRTTTAAVLGMIGTVIITGLAAYYVVYAAHLTGYSNEEAIYLTFDTHGSINLIGLLFGGIMIGLLGVLYDIAIGQAVAVEELFSAGQHLSRKEVYKKAIRIGREHIGALVNTLAIAYVGASLPLFLLIQTSTAGLLFILNSEIFATEIIRILIGSSGLVLGVPITTLIAVNMLKGSHASHVGHHH